MLAVELRRRLILELHRAGAGLLLGSDSPQIFNVPGFATHRELDVLVAAGLSPYEALRTGTVAVAEFLGTNTGTVAVGRDADLVLLDANPLDDIGNGHRIHGVMLRGKWHPAADLETRLAPYRRGRQ
ncbi:MAG: amidohydrolase family protein [Woeseiaceae bacterium]